MNLSPDKVFKRSFVSSGKKGGTMPNPKQHTPENLEDSINDEKLFKLSKVANRVPERKIDMNKVLTEKGLELNLSERSDSISEYH